MGILSAVGSYAKAIGNVNASLFKAVLNSVERSEAEVKVSVSGSTTEKYCCGFAKHDLLAPDELSNYCIAGYAVGKRLTGVSDLCYARAVWLDDKSGLGGVIFIVLDVIGISYPDVQNIRERLSDFCAKTGCRSVNVMSTHNHETIDTLGPWGDLYKLESGRVERYMQTVFAAAADAAEKAYENRRDGELYYGTVNVEPEIIMDGRYRVSQDDSRYPFETDSSLARFRFKPDDGSKEIFIVNYAAHAEALFSDNRQMSADYPGALCEIIAREHGADTLFINGAIGGLVMPGFYYNAEADVISLSSDELKRSADKLGNAFTDDVNNINCGFPVLIGFQDEPISRENDIIIADELQLLRFAEFVNAGNTMAGITVHLVSDIDLRDVPWNSIGSLEKRFRGCFDGGGHTIKGLMIDGGGCTGFFSALGKDAELLNLTLSGYVCGGRCTGAFAGFADGENIRLNGLRSFVNVKGGESVGGIVGRLCRATASHCENRGEVSSERSRVGGIAGYASECKIDFCFNRGIIKCADIVAGGISGEAEHTTITNCYNSASVFPRMCRNAAQIAGKLSDNSKVTCCFGNSDECICPPVSYTRVGMNGEIDVYSQKDTFAAYLARYVLKVEDTMVSTGIDMVTVNDWFEIKNTVLAIAALGGLINNNAVLVREKGKKHGKLMVHTGVTYIRLGGADILLVPGELFTELATGKYLDDRHAASPRMQVPESLNSVFGSEVRIFGLANDEIGYIIPPNDFYLNEKLPYINDATDRNGKKHYEETNSLGPNTAKKIASLAAIAKKAMTRATA